MPRSLTRRVALLACSIGTATSIPLLSASAQAIGPLAPLINQDILPLGEYLRTYAYQVPFVRSVVGVGWDRTVYLKDPTKSVSGISCGDFDVVWSQCLNNPNAPAVDQLENGRAGAETNTINEVVSRQIATTPMGLVGRPTEGSASAKASTDLSSNRVYAAARGGFERETFFPSYTSFQAGLSGGSERDEKLWMSASAISLWTNTFTPNYTGAMTIGLSAFLHGSGDDENAYLGQVPWGGNRDAEATLRFGVFDPTQETFYGSEFAYLYSYSPFYIGPRWVTGLMANAASAYGLTGYTVTMDVVAGRTYSMVMGLEADVRQNGLLDLYGTSKVDYFEVPDGGAVNFGGGSFAVRTPGSNGGAPISTVPEPSTVVLLAAGLAGALALRRRPKRQRASAPARVDAAYGINAAHCAVSVYCWNDTICPPANR